MKKPNQEFNYFDDANNNFPYIKTESDEFYNFYTKDNFYRLGNIWMVIEGALLLLAFLVFAIYFFIMVANSYAGYEYWAIMGCSSLVLLAFALLILIPSANQLKHQKANRKNQLFIMILACLTANIFGIVFIAIGMCDENRYLIRSEQRRYDNSLLD